jgi:hypothetical protein
MKEPLPDCVGGGGTTVFDGSGTLPLGRRCKSCETSAEGGGATTDGACRVSFGFRMPARSGADTGGGITAKLFICTGVLEVSRLTPPGAGGITLAAIVGVDRDCWRVTLGAGATTDVFREGALSARSRDTLGAGGTIAGASAGATNLCSPATLGAGGIRMALRFGAVSVRSGDTDGAGAITSLS